MREELPPLSPLGLELGFSLVHLVEDGQLSKGIPALRATLDEKRRLALPPIRIRDNLQLFETGWRILVWGQPVEEGVLEDGSDGHAILHNLERVVLEQAPALFGFDQLEQQLSALPGSTREALDHLPRARLLLGLRGRLTNVANLNLTAEAWLAAAASAQWPPAWTGVHINHLHAPTIQFALGSQLHAAFGEEIRNRMASQNLRLGWANEWGFVPGPIDVCVDPSIESDAVVAKLGQVTEVQARLKTDRLLAIGPDGIDGPLLGRPGSIATIEPVFGLPAVWIETTDQDLACSEGYSVVDIPSVVVTLVGDVMSRFAPQLLGVDELHGILERVRSVAPILVGELEKHPYLTDERMLSRLRHHLQEEGPLTHPVAVLERLVFVASRMEALDVDLTATELG